MKQPPSQRRWALDRRRFDGFPFKNVWRAGFAYLGGMI